MADYIKTTSDSNKNLPLKEQEKAILDAVRSLKYGSVEVVVHEGRVMEVTKKQRVRFKGNESESAEQA